METMQRIVLFLVGCIGLRLLFVYVAKTVPLSFLPLLGYVAVLPAVGMMYLFFTNPKTTGFFGGPLWWNDTRLFHSLCYGLFAYHAIQKSPTAWVYLLIDVVLGLLFFIGHYFHKL
jgi:hypothetical protein